MVWLKANKLSLFRPKQKRTIVNDNITKDNFGITKDNTKDNFGIEQVKVTKFIGVLISYQHFTYDSTMGKKFWEIYRCEKFCYDVSVRTREAGQRLETGVFGQFSLASTQHTSPTN